MDLDQVYRLITDRASGRATNDQVEQAVTQLLTSNNNNNRQQNTTASASASLPTTTTSQPGSSTATEQDEDEINQAPPPTRVQEDLENYDDDDDDEEEEQNKANESQSETDSKPARNKPITPSESSSKPKNPSKQPKFDYTTIPLGPQAAPMMRAFGDGPQPHPAALTLCLERTRALLLGRTVADARHVRRRKQAQFQAARLYHTKFGKLEASHNSNNTAQRAKSHWTNAVLFQAQSGQHYVMPPCGFAMEDLHATYPEAMNSYLKWSQMYQEQQEASSENKNGEDDNSNDKDKNSSNNNNNNKITEPDDNDDNNDNNDDDDDMIGHLRQRAQQMDWRTNRMVKRKYLEFCDVRRAGSFLPQKLTSTRYQEAWDDVVQDTKGKNRAGWANLAYAEVRFLHWMGFSPYANASLSSDEQEDDDDNKNNNNNKKNDDTHSNLAPPDPATTHALAFLAHDFFGQIVEKAIAVHKQEQKQTRDKKAVPTNKSQGDAKTGDDDDEENDIQELEEYEQLTEHDVQQALQHADLQPTSLFSQQGDNDDTSNRNKKASSSLAQLYFGPGFEDRVEMEMEELLLQHEKEARHDDDEETRQWRQKEDAFLGQLVKQAPGSEQELIQMEQLQRHGQVMAKNNDATTTTPTPAAKKKSPPSKKTSPASSAKKSKSTATAASKTSGSGKKRRVAFSPQLEETSAQPATVKRRRTTRSSTSSSKASKK